MPETTALQVDWKLTVVRENDLPIMCSRAGPDASESSWTPTRADLEDLESRLPLAIDQSALPKPLVQYCRAYYGLIRSGRRYIYVDARWCKSAEDKEHALGQVPQVVCDGGAYYWGIELDFESKAFTELTTNGQ